MAIKFDSTIIGKRYDRLVVLTKADKSLLNTTFKGTMLVCQCDCGNEIITRFSSLNYGSSRSCGCLQKESIIGNTMQRTHNMEFTPEYSTWGGMKSRCINEREKSYKYYGGRGIKVCDRWLNSFENFYADMGSKPTSQHSIDRIDVDGDYEPSNCRWATKIEQANNTRTNTFYTFENETLTMANWARKLSASYPIFVEYVKRTSIEKAVAHYSIKKIVKNV